MVLVMMLGVMIALGSESGPEAVVDPGYNAGLTLLVTILVVALAPVPGIVLSATVRPENLSDPYRRARTLRRVRVGTACYQGYLLAAYAFVTWALDWPVLIDGTLRLRGWVLVDEMMRLAPFVAMLVLSWAPLYRIDRQLRAGAWTLRKYMEFNLRQYVLFVLAPFAALVTVVDVLGHLPWAGTLERTGLDWAIAIATMGALFVFSPHMIRHVWKTRRLEEGPLRARLSALCAHARMTCRDILVWDTLGGQVVNACVMGVVASARYVMVTDALMESLSEEEIEGVFAHEIGHVRRHHMLYYGVFAAGFAATVILTGWLAAHAGKAWTAHYGAVSAENALVTLAAGLYWGVGFGFVSRRMEQEADVYAVELTGNTGSFVNALERISYYGGRPRTSGSWRHYSIAKRTEFLSVLETDPARRERFRRAMRMLRWGVVAFTAAAAGAAVILMK
jgi:Zn-dependent protease with chaperone function